MDMSTAPYTVKKFHFGLLIGSIFFFVLVGPPVGSLAITLFIGVIGLFTNPGWSTLGDMLLFGFAAFFFGYIFGFLPALGAGILVGLKPEWFNSKKSLLGLFGGGGLITMGVLSGASVLFSSSSLNNSWQDIWGVYAFAFALGGVSTTVTFLLFKKLLKNWSISASIENLP